MSRSTRSWGSGIAALALRFDDVNCSVLTTVQGNATAENGAEALLIAQTLDHTD